MQADKKRTSLVLMELIICILFFSVVSALCTKVFVTAYLQNKESTAESKALAECQSVMEIILSDNCSFDTLTTIYPSASVDDSSFTSSDAEGRLINVKLSFEGKMCTVTASVDDSEGHEIISLKATKFTGGDAHEE